MSQEVHAKKARVKNGISRHYRSNWDIANRALLASIGGYGVTTLFTIFISTLPVGDVAINVMSATQYSFLIMTAIAISSFCMKSTQRAWIINIVTGIVLAVATGVNHGF